MKELALTLPGLKEGTTVDVPQLPGVKPTFTDLGSLLSQSFDLLLALAAALTFVWFVWGVFQYIFSGGEKGGIDAARKRITWAIVGFFFILLSFMISQFAQSIFPQVNTFNKATSVSKFCTKQQADDCAGLGQVCIINESGSHECKISLPQ